MMSVKVALITAMEKSLGSGDVTDREILEATEAAREILQMAGYERGDRVRRSHRDCDLR